MPERSSGCSADSAVTGQRWRVFYDGSSATLKLTCYPDTTGDCLLDIFDFLAFTNAFNAQTPDGDCDGNTVYDIFDFLCFVNAFNAGC